MAKLNQDERRYAMKRVAEIEKVLVEDLREKCTTKVKGLTNNEKINQIKNGYADVKQRGWNLNTSIGECFQYDQPEQKSLDSTKFFEARKELRKKAAEVTDEIMLGDAEKAKKLLKEFEKSCK